MTTKFGGEQQGGLVTSDPERHTSRLHYVVARDGDNGLEVLLVPLEGKGQVLPVFSAGWAASGSLFAEAPGGGWYVKTCTPDELVFLLVGPCAGVEWVALDPRPGPRRGRGGNRHAAGELRGLPVGFDASLYGFEETTPRLSAVSRMDERTIGSEMQEALGTVCGPCKRWRRERRHYRHER